MPVKVLKQEEVEVPTLSEFKLLQSSFDACISEAWNRISNLEMEVSKLKKEKNNEETSK